MIVVREIESCPNCGLANPWRKGKRGYSRVVHGERHIKVFCRRCGHPATVIYREKCELVPQWGKIVS